MTAAATRLLAWRARHRQGRAREDARASTSAISVSSMRGGADVHHRPHHGPRQPWTTGCSCKTSCWRRVRGLQHLSAGGLERFRKSSCPTSAPARTKCWSAACRWATPTIGGGQQLPDHPGAGSRSRIGSRSREPPLSLCRVVAPAGHGAPASAPLQAVQACAGRLRAAAFQPPKFSPSWGGPARRRSVPLRGCEPTMSFFRHPGAQRAQLRHHAVPDGGGLTLIFGVTRAS